MKFIYFLLFSFLSLQALSQTSDRLEPIDIFDIELVGDPQISPDGRQIVYVRNFKDIMTDGNRSNLWIVNSDGSAHRPLTSGNQNDYAPRWSPGGDRLAYVSTEKGKPQIYMRWMKDGVTAKMTNLVKAPQSMVWSPDGTRLALVMSVKEEMTRFNVMPEKPKGAKWADDPIYIDEMQYRRDGAGYVDKSFNQIFLLSAEGGTPRQITTGKYNHSGVSWSPDGQSLVFSANHHGNEMETRNSEIHELNLQTGKMTTLTDRFGPDGSPKVSPDGKMIAYTGLDDNYMGYMVQKLYVMDRDGSNRKVVCDDLDRDIGNVNWSADGQSLVFQYDDKGMTYIAKTDLSGNRKVITRNVGGLSLGRPYSGGTFSLANDGTVAYTLGTTEHPADLAVAGTRGAKRLTNVNEDLFEFKKLGKVEEIWYKSSHDQRDIQGWIIYPPDFDASKKYPLMLEIHGGPFTNYGFRFSAECQLFAAKGYVVLYTNPRGSTSYGSEFGNLIHHNYPGEDYHDLMSGVDAVIDKGFIDEDQLYVTGGSGGGVLTSWIIGNTDRFRAAVVAKPVINWYSFVLYADNPAYFYKYWFPGKPWEHSEHYMKRSPISLVGNVTTPTMLLTGEQDWRTPISESEQYYAALKIQGVDAALVRIPGASHSIARKPSQLIAKVNSITRWFEEHSKSKSTRP